MVTLSACGIVTIERQGASKAPEPTDAYAYDMRTDPTFAKRVKIWDREAFPVSAPLVEAAEAETDPAKAEPAFRKAFTQVLEEHRTSKTAAHASEPFDRLISRAHAGLGLSLHALGRDMDAAMTLLERPFDSGRCHATVRPRCEELRDFLLKTYPGMVSNYRADVRLFATNLAVFDRTTSVETLDYFVREMGRKKGVAIVRASVTTKQPAGSGTTLKIEGMTTSGMYDKCKQIGTLEIPAENKRYLLERCHKEKTTFVGASVVATTDAAGAALVTEQKDLSYEGKNDVWLLYDPAKMKRVNKGLLDLGTVSVWPAPARDAD